MLIIVFQNVNKEKSSLENYAPILGFSWEKYWNYLIYFMVGVVQNEAISMSSLDKHPLSARVETIPHEPISEAEGDLNRGRRRP
jgi:hypothetical protein